MGSQLRLVPVTLGEARRFIAEHHRHNGPPQQWRFGVGLECDGQLVGVAIAETPKAWANMRDHTLEITRSCTLGARNANSMLYAALLRAAKALGWRAAITYTLPSESGASLRAVGFQPDGEAEAGRLWEKERGTSSHAQTDLFGRQHYPLEAKIRWRINLG